MEAVRDGCAPRVGAGGWRRIVPVRRLVPMLGAGLLAGLGLPLSACGEGSSSVSAQSGPERASQLAHVWAAHVGAPDRTLDAAGDMPLGDTGIAYDPTRDTLYGRVWVTMALTKGAPADEIATLRRMEAALNDPRMGGLYEHAGGYFVLDEKREGYFLVRAFPVAQTTPEKLVRDMERMQTVAARWTTKWFLDVAMIMHGKEPPPAHPVTLDN
jgi:hypothetical protein